MKKKYTITSIENPHHIFSSTNKTKIHKGPADFEEAITAAGYGKYNVLVLITMIPTCFATAFSTATMSYVFPIAQCDLDLSLDDKGMLNSVTYIGMITSGFMFGYLTDAVGRRKLLVYVFIIDGFLVVLCGLCQQYIPLLIVKFLNGFVVNGGYAAYIAYGNEFHAAKYRPLVALYNAILMNTASTFIPFLGWLIFTDKINISLFDGYIVLRSWNIFLLVCSIPSFVACFTFLMMPESPKFLMSVGRNKEALQVFRTVYSVNAGLSPDTYPVRNLIEEKPQNENNGNAENATQQKCRLRQLAEGWHETTRLFHAPYHTKMILVLIIHFGFLLGLNTLRLWLPQLLIAIYDQDTPEQPKEFDFCGGLETLSVNNANETLTCSVNYDNKNVYIYVIICGMGILCFLLLSIGVVLKVSKKRILVIGGCLSGISCVMIYFSQNLPMLIVFYIVHLGLVYVANNVVLAVVVNVFPTCLRALAISLTMASGRSGSFLGNIIFSPLLTAGCVYPFATIGSVLTVVSLLTLLLPDAEMTPLQ